MSEEEVVDAVKEVTMSEEDEKEEVVEPKEPSIEAFTDEESSSGGMKEESMDEKMSEDEKKEEVEEEGEKEEDNATMKKDDTNQITTEEVAKNENNDAEMNEENVNEENDKENESKGEKDAEIKTEETKEDDKIDDKNGANEEDIDGFVMIGDEEEEKEQDKETMDKENESKGEKDAEIKTEEAKEDDKIDVKDGANEEDNDGFEVIGDEEEEEEEEKKKKGEDGTETTNSISQEQSRHYTVTAHSGCERTDPGSLTSIEVGIDKGAQIVEIDVRVRDDGVPVLAHDLKEKRRPGATTLEEALCCVSTNSDTVQVNIDLKEFDNMGAVYGVIQRVKMEDRVFFTGVSEGNLVRVMEGAPGIRLYVNVDTPGKTEKDDEALYDRLEKIPGVKDGEKRILLGINTHHKNITPKYIEFWHNHGYEVSVFTINSASLALKIYNCGADNITTKTPAVVIETLKSGVASSTCHVS